MLQYILCRDFISYGGIDGWMDEEHENMLYR